MLFSSITFLYCFLPCVLLVYFIVPDRMKNFVLLSSSLLFYGWGEPKYLAFMLASIAQSYIAARLVERLRGTAGARLVTALSAAASLGLLAYCKYADFFIENFNALTGLSVPLLRVALPVGISFYTFQILSYVIDVYRGDVPAQRNFIDLAMYVAMFPQLIAGPIVRYSDIAGSLKNRRTSLADASEGITRFSVGLAKKILLANQAALIVSEFKASGEKQCCFIGCIPFHICCTSISTFRDTPTWRSAWGASSGSASPRTSTTLIFPQASRNSGAAGIFLSAGGSAITCISRLAETE